MHDALKELGILMEDVERLFQRVASEGGERVGDSVEELQSNMARLRKRFHDFQRRAPRELRRTIRRTEQYVHDNPWQTVGLAAAVGFVLGAVIARRD